MQKRKVLGFKIISRILPKVLLNDHDYFLSLINELLCPITSTKLFRVHAHVGLSNLVWSTLDLTVLMNGLHGLSKQLAVHRAKFGASLVCAGSGQKHLFGYASDLSPEISATSFTFFWNVLQSEDGKAVEAAKSKNFIRDTKLSSCCKSGA